MKKCMNPKCGAVSTDGVEVTIAHRATSSGARVTAELWACCSDCATEVQAEHANKSAIYGSVIAGRELGLLGVSMAGAGGMVS